MTARQFEAAYARLQRLRAEFQRGHERFRFLCDTIAVLRPDIQDPGHMPLDHLIQLIEPTHPDLAEQLRELCRV